MVSRFRSDAGFTLAELLIATGLLLVVSSIVTSAVLQMTNQQQTIWNRTEMHSGVRGATELLQQEVGQAGRIALPNPITSAPIVFVPAATDCTQVNGVQLFTTTAGANPTDGMWFDPVTNTGVSLTWLDGINAETVRVNGIDTVGHTISGCFWANHPGPNPPVVVRGAFANGIVPPSPPSPLPNGSDGNHLKLFGDINGDGKMVYIEYICDNGDIPGLPDPVASHNLYRNTMKYDWNLATDGPKPSVDNSKILLTNVHTNPLDVSGAPRPCFQYQTASLKVQGAQFTFVLDVAVTLTVWTQSVDPITKQFQQETKALLNVSPRNVFFSWELASIGYTDHIQSTPGTVTTLLNVVQSP